MLVECDTGAGRNGVQSPEAALRLAQAIDRAPHLVIRRIDDPAEERRARAHGGLSRSGAERLLAASGLDVPEVSTGGSPDMWKDDGLAHVSEYRAGTYIYFDRMQVAAGSATPDDCALSVLSTVVSVPTGDRAMLDAGSKALTSDLVGLEGYGEVRSLSGALVYNMSEEHGFSIFRG